MSSIWAGVKSEKGGIKIWEFIVDVRGVAMKKSALAFGLVKVAGVPIVRSVILKTGNAQVAMAMSTRWVTSKKEKLTRTRFIQDVQNAVTKRRAPVSGDVRAADAFIVKSATQKMDNAQIATVMSTE